MAHVLPGPGGLRWPLAAPASRRSPRPLVALRVSVFDCKALPTDLAAPQKHPHMLAGPHRNERRPQCPTFT